MSSIPEYSPNNSQAVVDRLIDLYERLTPGDLARLDAYYAADAQFKDPFNDVKGVPAIAQVFAHMFENLVQPHFVVTQRLVQDDQAFLAWEFRFRMRRWQTNNEHCIRGATLVRFNTKGLVILHRDYWDTAEELYEKLPLIGGLMRWLRRSNSATQRF